MKTKAPLYVGIDWGMSKHEAAFVESGVVLDKLSFGYSSEGHEKLHSWLLKISDGDLCRIWVGIDRPKGPLISSLLEWGCRVFALNPRRMDRFRERMTMTERKDDKFDAAVIGHSLETDAPCFQECSPERSVVVQLRQWSRLRDQLKEQQVRESNNLMAQLLEYYPQFLKLKEGTESDWQLELLEMAPTPTAASKLSKAEVSKLLKRHRIRRLTASEVLEHLQTPMVTVNEGLCEALSEIVVLTAQRLKLLNQQVRRVDRELKATRERHSQEERSGKEDCEAPTDVEIMESFPGLGLQSSTALLAEAADLIEQADYSTLRLLSGVAPVTIQSGTYRRVVRRRGCNKRLNTALYNWALASLKNEPVARAKYKEARAKNKGHNTALRELGDHLLLVLCSMLRHRRLYDPRRRVVKKERNSKRSKCA